MIVNPSITEAIQQATTDTLEQALQDNPDLAAADPKEGISLLLFAQLRKLNVG